MKLTVNNLKGFNAALKTAAQVVEKKSTMPVLSHVRLYQENDKTFFMSTNLETAVKVDISSTVCVEEAGDALIPAKVLKDYATKRKQEFMITTDENWGTIGTMRVALLPSSDFPAWLDQGKERLGIITDLSQKIKQVFYAAGESDTRYTLNGLYFDFTNKRLVGTDGHRLALTAIDMNSEKPVIIKREAMKIMQTLKTDPEIATGDSHTLFDYGKGLMQILASNIVGTYPNVDNVLPKTFNSICAVNREALLQTIDRVSLVSRAKANEIGLYCRYLGPGKQELGIYTSNPDIGEAEEFIPCTWDPSAIIHFGVNGRYLMDCLKAMDCEEVVICYGGELTPIKIVDPENADSLHVIMPMRTDLAGKAYFPYSKLPDDMPADVKDQIMARIWQARISRKLAKARERSL
jgi:DNA polymerase-3 subunit beta